MAKYRCKICNFVAESRQPSFYCPKCNLHPDWVEIKMRACPDCGVFGCAECPTCGGLGEVEDLSELIEKFADRLKKP